VKLLTTLTQAGLNFTKTSFERRGVLLSNQISLIVFSLGLILFGIYCWWFGITVTAQAIPITCVICILLIGLNKLGFTTISRLIISLYLPVVVTIVSIYSKSIYYEVLQPVDYFTYRFIILGACVFPAVIFSIHEKKILIAIVLINLGILMGYDSLHEVFGVGYRVNQTVGYYHFANTVIFITYWILLGTVLFLKKNAEKNETENYQLIQELSDQQHEIQAQADELSLSQQKLQEANELITKQNISLEGDLVIRNKELSEANEELIKNNNELNQFSFAVSHNLRGPIASLLGLTDLLKKETLDKENREIIDHIQSSTQNLDGIIKDLNSIIDIRHTIFQSKQNIDLNQEISEIFKVFQNEIRDFKVAIVCNFAACPEIYSIQPMVHSIMFNLVSNSIKYHSSERPPKIEIMSHRQDDYFILTVQDNGIGIDLTRDGNSLFKIFKRFNEHTEGRGLGLYLVKTQAEALGGKVEVESQLNQYTCFKVYIKIP
jgi:signal transduction histidine kinase